jgi:hypothetical protein
MTPAARPARAAECPTRLRNLPLHGSAHNQLRCEFLAMACELTVWMQKFDLDGPARAWELERLPLFSGAECWSATARACGCASP